MRRPSSRTTTRLHVSPAAPITGRLFRRAARFEVWLRQFDPLQIVAATVLVGLAAYVMWQNWQNSRPVQGVAPIIIVAATEQPGDLELVGKVVAPLAGGAALRSTSAPQPQPADQQPIVQP